MAPTPPEVHRMERSCILCFEIERFGRWSLTNTDCRRRTPSMSRFPVSWMIVFRNSLRTDPIKKSMLHSFYGWPMRDQPVMRMEYAA